MQKVIKRNDYFTVKNDIKKQISKLSDYSLNEEMWLICYSLNKSQEDLIKVNSFAKNELKKISKAVKQRLKGKPLNKIFKRQFFFEDEFFVNNYCLSPRKETEILVELGIKEIQKNKYKKVLDLCCGSGAIGLSVAKHCKEDVFVELSDVSRQALKVCKKNTKNLKLQKNTKIVKSNMFSLLKTQNKFDIILSNPPYIKTNEIQNLDYGVKNFDPILSLDGGEDGLKFYKIIANQSKEFLKDNGCVLVEIGFDQKKEVEKIFEDYGYKVTCFKDYGGNDRVVKAVLKENKDND